MSIVLPLHNHRGSKSYPMECLCNKRGLCGTNTEVRSRIRWNVYVINMDFVLNSTLVHPNMSSTCQVLIVATSTTRQHTCLSVWDIKRMKQLPGFPSHFFGLTKIHDISMIFPGFLK